MDTHANLSPASLAIEAHGAVVAVTWADGRLSRFPALWLADNRPETRRGAEAERHHRCREDDERASGVCRELHFFPLMRECFFV